VNGDWESSRTRSHLLNQAMSSAASPQYSSGLSMLCRWTASYRRRYTPEHTSHAHWLNNNNSSQSHLGRAASPPLTVENELARCVCYYLCNAHGRRVPIASRRYATATPHRRTRDDGVYCASIASRDKNTPNSNLADVYSKRSSSTSYHPRATKVRGAFNKFQDCSSY